MSIETTTKPRLFDAQQIGWIVDEAREYAASMARQIANDKATLEYNRVYTEAYDSAYSEGLERAVYQMTKDDPNPEWHLPF